MFFKFDNNKEYSFRQSLLWEYDLKNFNWEQMKPTVVQRVVERGRIEDFQFILVKYGLNQVIQTIKQIPCLHKKDINFVCTVFHLEKQELQCCTTTPSHKTH